MLAHHEQFFSEKLKRPSTSAYAISHQVPQLDAVIIRNLTYEVGRGRNKRVILNKINLTVPEGSIYGLLGPSGCGKTTMLRCVVGRIRIRSGSVLVFGFRPGEGLSGVPGRNVGYMPQEISIYEDFTIEETLRYFGKINRMHDNEIKKRIEFLIQFLDLPSKKRLVVNLSGGQKRRVSLAAALVHSPPLLILDEPTVGVDPLLRQSIWKHLVTLTQSERISVIITTHYIEEARQANVVGLMRHGKILAENSPDELMRIHALDNLEDVFLKLCVTDSSLRAATLATEGPSNTVTGENTNSSRQPTSRPIPQLANGRPIVQDFSMQQQNQQGNDVISASLSRRWESMSRKQRLDAMAKAGRQLEADLFTRQTNGTGSSESTSGRRTAVHLAGTGSIRIHTGTNKIEIYDQVAEKEAGVYTNEAVEVFSSEDEAEESSSESFKDSERAIEGDGKRNSSRRVRRMHQEPTNFRHLIGNSAGVAHADGFDETTTASSDLMTTLSNTSELHSDDYLALQAMNWAARRSNALNMMSLRMNHDRLSSKNKRSIVRHRHVPATLESGLNQWWKTLMAVTWKNYIRLRRNPPVLVFQFMLPAIQVILFCLCIGREPFDVPVAIVNDEVVPRSSLEFLNGLNKRIIKQVRYDNLTSAIDAVRKGTVWGAIHIPDKYSQNLQTRLIMGEEVTNETISNGTIRVYPDLTNLHLALALETTFRETFMNFARDSLQEMGYDRSLADLPIQIGQPVYGSMKKDGYLEFMAPGVVISISYVMATGLTALAFILERRDGLLERSLVSGVQTSQILLAHAINQVVVMIIQIFLVLGCTFFVFEIPSRGPFFWVVLLILLQGCTGMAFGLLVSAVCAEENTAVMMLVGTFYTNLILAGIIWPIEAMPHWLRPLSYAQPQTLPTDTLRHILSRGWGITEAGVLLGFAVTIGWLVIFLMAAGLIFKYSG